MANKKIFMSVTATAVIASAFIAAEEVDAASHKVQSGDSLWAIAQKYNTSVSQLKSINKLSGDIIYPNQILETEKKQSSSNTNSSTSTKPKQPTKESTTYTVKSGDTLSEIASKHKISLTDLMKWNNLDTTLIFPGNVFVVSSGSGSSSSNSGNSGSSSGSISGANAGNSESTSGNSSSSAGSSIYTVKSGDTLSAIASRQKVTVANLKKWNNLTSDLILIGQKLSIGEAASSGTGNSTSGSNSGSNTNEKPAADDVSYNIDTLISTAKSVIGTGYVWGGQTTGGFDCSGFIHYAYNLAGKTGGRLSTDGYYDRSYSVDKPQIGDLVFFSGTYRAGISHMGIYIGNNEFIHAGTSTGVTITNLNNSYWSKHFDSFKRFY